MIISEREMQMSGCFDVTNIMRSILTSEHEIDQNKEHCWTIGLNTKNVVQYIELVSLGSLTNTIVLPLEVFRLAVMKGVASIVLCHNHPSGDTSPSGEDIALTKRLAQAGKILGIKVLDHVIISRTGHGFSFQEQGRFNPKLGEALHPYPGDEYQWHAEGHSSDIKKKKTIRNKKKDESVIATL